MDPAHYFSGAITVKEQGQLVNFGVINIEGTEGKPLDPTRQQQTQRDMQSAAIFAESGGLFDNYGCISLKETLNILGMLNNYGRYDGILRVYDPDKNLKDYHRGIQITWKDDVTQEGVVPGVLSVGLDADGKVVEGAEVNNYGDIVPVPGTINLYGTFNNAKYPDSQVDYAGHLYLCTVDEAIIPFVDPNDPTVVEKRVALDTPKESVFNKKNGTVNNEGGTIGYAKVELIHNGVLGDLTPVSEDDVIAEAEGEIAKAEEAVATAQKAMDDLLKTDNPSKADIQTAYNAVVAAQNALTKAQGKLTKAEQIKIQNLNKQVEKLNGQLAEMTVVDISNFGVTLSKTSFEYTGKEITPTVTVSGLTSGDYTVTYKNNKAVGKATVTITANADKNFKGTITETFTIEKAANTMKAKAKKVVMKYAKVKKANQTVKRTKAITVKKAQGKVAYKLVSVSKGKFKKHFKVTKAGKITVKKGLKKGTYTVKVKVTAKGDANYKKLAKTVKVKVVVK